MYYSNEKCILLDTQITNDLITEKPSIYSSIIKKSLVKKRYKALAKKLNVSWQRTNVIMASA